MAEYIERESAMLLPELPKEYRHYQTDNLDDAYEQGWDDALCCLEHIPAADVVQVVRCRDCKYYRVSAMLAPNKFCFRLKHPVEDRPIGYNFAPDDFCSHGERLGEVKSDAKAD